MVLSLLAVNTGLKTAREALEVNGGPIKLDTFSVAHLQYPTETGTLIYAIMSLRLAVSQPTVNSWQYGQPVNILMYECNSAGQMVYAFNTINTTWLINTIVSFYFCTASPVNAVTHDH